MRPIFALMVPALLLAACANSPLTTSSSPTTATSRPAMTSADHGPASATFVLLPSTPGSANGGTLAFNGRQYGFTADGLTAAKMGSAPGPVSGEIYNLKTIDDLKGTFTSTMMPGGKEALLQNPAGVMIHVTATSGLEMNGDPFAPGKMKPGQVIIVPVAGGV